jgi:hypothetical protein
VKNIFLYPVEALNCLRMNVWSVGLIVAGSVLVLHGHADVGASLTTGGFALLRSEGSQASQQPPQAITQNPPKV